MPHESTFSHTNFASVKDQYRHAQKALYVIEQQAALKNKTKARNKVKELFLWSRDERISSDVWDLVRSELRRIGEENQEDLIGIFNHMEKEADKVVPVSDPEEVLEKVGTIDWMGEEEAK